MSATIKQIDKKKILAPQLRFKQFDGNWNKTKLADITSKISDGLHSTPNYDENGEYYFVNGNNLIDDKIYFAESTKKVNKDEYLKHRKELSDRTILISINGTIGSLALYNSEKIILGKSACYLNLNNDVNKHFVYNSLKTTGIRNFFNAELTGSTIKNLSLTTIKNCEFSFPSLPEQQKIASFLSAIDEKIQQLTRKKELLEQYKKGVMQQLFTGKLRFKDENGKAYPKWEEKRLGEIGNFKGGGTPTKDEGNWVGKIPWISSSDIFESDIRKIQISRFINQNSLKNSATHLIPKGSVLFISRVGVGKLAINELEICTSQDFINFTPLQVNPYFIGYLFIERKNILLNFCQGTSIKGFTKNDLESVNISIPKLEEQQKIASYLSSIDTKIESVNKQIEHTQKFKKGLLQQMFV